MDDQEEITEEDAKNLIPILQKDDIESFKKLIFPYSTVNLILATINNEMPVCFRKRPYIIDVAAYYNAINCLGYIFSFSENNIKHEDAVFFFLSQVFISYFSFSCTFCSIQWHSQLVYAS